MSYKLYTWVDVESLLIEQKHNWPDGLLSITGYWDKLEVGITNYNDSTVISFLAKVFKENFINYNNHNYYIKLESYDEEIKLPVVFLEVDKPNFKLKPKPTILRDSITWNLKVESFKLPYKHSRSACKIFAFNSAVGGVGNTNRLLSLAKNGVLKNKSILIIDGNFNSPKITHLLKSKLDLFDISFANFIALIHGDRCEKAMSAVKLTMKNIKYNKLDGLYILPAFCSNKLVNELVITPQQLMKGHKNPFILTDALFNLGVLLSLDYILVDLPYGNSDVSFCFTLDPRIQRFSIVNDKSSTNITYDFIEELYITRKPYNEHIIYFNEQITSNDECSWFEYFKNLDTCVGFPNEE